MKKRMTDRLHMAVQAILFAGKGMKNGSGFNTKTIFWI